MGDRLQQTRLMRSADVIPSYGAIKRDGRNSDNTFSRVIDSGQLNPLSPPHGRVNSVPWIRHLPRASAPMAARERIACSGASPAGASVDPRQPFAAEQSHLRSFGSPPEGKTAPQGA